MTLTKASLTRSVIFGNGAYSFGETGQSVESDSIRVWEIPLPALPAENTGTLTINGSAVLALSTGHNITDSDLVDAYWLDGTTPKHRYGLSAAVSGNNVTLTDGADAGGDALQTATTVTLCKQVATTDLAIIGNNVEWLALIYDNASTPTARASIDMHDAAGTEFQAGLVHHQALGGCAKVYNVDKGDTNPIATDTITDGHSSHNATTAATLYVLVLMEATA
jgi:hypothetical protein